MCIRMMLVLREEKKRVPENFNKKNAQKGNYKTILCWKDTAQSTTNESFQTRHSGVYCHTRYMADGL